MTHSADYSAICQFRRARVLHQLQLKDVAGIVLFDPINIRYATASRNMQVWSMHNFCRYCFISADGYTVLFEVFSARHLHDQLTGIDEIRPSLAADYMMVGPRGEEIAERWARELADLVDTHAGKNKRLALDRADLLHTHALQNLGFELQDGKEIMELARSIKSSQEVSAFVRSLRTCESAISAMREYIEPGMRESEALAKLIGGSIKLGGEYPETRLLTSGPRTNPWFQEAGDRVMQEGDLLAFDTDLIGPDGFYNDISRSWVIGDRRPTDQQRRLYDLSRRQLEHNIALLRPGISFLEYSENAFELPAQFIANRYADVAHGCGMGVEYPLIWYQEDVEAGAYDGILQENMIVCVESYVGEEAGSEGVKLEQPVLVTDRGPVVLSEYPLENDYA